MKKQNRMSWHLLWMPCLDPSYLVRPLLGQKKGTKTTQPAAVPAAAPKTAFDESLYNSLQWRSIGPFRGGRSAAVTGVPGKPNLYYFGSTGGGVWRTRDGGQTWENISDGYFGGSVGAVAVADSDHNVIYAGGGEVTVRGNVSYGFGMWKTTDAGKTWKHVGLKESRHIPRIRIHPEPGFGLCRRPGRPVQTVGRTRRLPLQRWWKNLGTHLVRQRRCRRRRPGNGP